MHESPEKVTHEIQEEYVQGAARCEVCVYGPGNGRLGSNPVEEHAGLTV